MRPFQSLGAAAVGVAAVSRALLAQCESQWRPGGWKLGFDGPVRCSTIWDADGPGPAPAELVVAGMFTIAGDESAGAVASWDGARWRGLGDGLTGTVSAVTVHEGGLVVGGTFITAGPAHATNIARLNGGVWESMDGGIGAGVSALGSLDGGLFAAQSTGYNDPSRVLRWTGAAWEQAGQLLVGQIGALLTFNGQPLLAGNRTGVMGLAGSSWVRLGTVQSAYTATVWNDQLILGKGGFFNARDVFRWDGAAWQPMYDGLIVPSWSQLSSVVAFGAYHGALLAAGQVETTMGSGLPRWDGLRWVGVGGAPSFPLNQQVSTLTPFGDDLIAGGDFSLAGPVVANDMARWNGQTWARCTGLPILNSQDMSYVPTAALAAASFAGGLAVGGAFLLDTAGGRCSNIAWWDGVTWSPLGSGFSSDWTGEVVRALVQYEGGLVAGGAFAELGPHLEGVARWDGSAWRPLGLNADVYALCVSNGDLVAGMGFGASVRQWNGALWIPLGTPPNGTVRALTSYSGDLIAAGQFDSAGGSSASNIARWDGVQWHPLGVGLPTAVSALTVFQDRLVAASEIGTASRLLYWDGNAWHDWPVISYFTSTSIHALAADAGNMYLAGMFADFAGVPARSIVKWDGIQWAQMDQGLVETRYPGALASAASLLADGGRVVVTGQFTVAGGLPSPGVAIWERSAPECYANCDCSTGSPSLTVNDFVCFMSRFFAGDAYANCDGSTATPALNVQDFTCFLNPFAAGCS